MTTPSQEVSVQEPLQPTAGNAVAVIGLLLTLAAMLVCGLLFGAAAALAEHESERTNPSARQTTRSGNQDGTAAEDDAAQIERSSEQLRVLLLASVAAVLNLVGLILCVAGLLIPNRPRAAAIGGTIISSLLFVGVFGVMAVGTLFQP